MHVESAPFDDNGRYDFRALGKDQAPRPNPRE